MKEAMWRIVTQSAGAEGESGGERQLVAPNVGSLFSGL